MASTEHEMVAVPKLLELLDLAGCLVTLDAMGGQQKIAKAMRQPEADDVLRLKDHHPVVRQAVEALFDDCLTHNPAALTFDEQVDGGHGRVEVRRRWSSGNVGWFTDVDKWHDLNSRPASDTSMLQRAIRAHWG